MWLATTPWVLGLTPVTMETWVGHVVLGKTVSIPAARAAPKIQLVVALLMVPAVLMLVLGALAAAILAVPTFAADAQVEGTTFTSTVFPVRTRSGFGRKSPSHAIQYFCE